MACVYIWEFEIVILLKCISMDRLVVICTMGLWSWITLYTICIYCVMASTIVNLFWLALDFPSCWAIDKTLLSLFCHTCTWQQNWSLFCMLLWCVQFVITFVKKNAVNIWNIILLDVSNVF